MKAVFYAGAVLAVILVWFLFSPPLGISNPWIKFSSVIAYILAAGYLGAVIWKEVIAAFAAWATPSRRIILAAIVVVGQFIAAAIIKQVVA